MYCRDSCLQLSLIKLTSGDRPHFRHSSKQKPSATDGIDAKRKHLFLIKIVNLIQFNSFDVPVLLFYHRHTDANDLNAMANAVENITYSCTKVNIENEGPITSGCYSQVIDGHEVQVCVCKSNVGQIPCNSTQRNKENAFTILIFIFLATAFRCLLPYS